MLAVAGGMGQVRGSNDSGSSPQAHAPPPQPDLKTLLGSYFCFSSRSFCTFVPNMISLSTSSPPALPTS